MKMGWYKVLRSSFDYALAALDPVLTDLGVKEKETIKLPLSQALQFERDSDVLGSVLSRHDWIIGRNDF